MTNEELESLAKEIEAMKHDILTLCIPEPKCKAWAVASFEDAAARIRSKIVKPRIKRTVWLNVFRNGEVVSTSEPPEHYITTRFACVPVEIDCEEGEGL
jgi:hypothetical protein